MLQAAWKAVVGERGVRPDEDVILDNKAVPELDSAFNGDAIAHNDVVLDERVIADVAIGADTRARKDMSEGPNTRTFPDVFRFNEGSFVFEKSRSGQSGSHWCRHLRQRAFLTRLVR
jgi:hypothetical protein